MEAIGYRAEVLEDGTMIVFDVPIFAECARGDTKFNADWISKAVEEARKGEIEGYMPPLHIRHHESGAPNEVTPAGYFQIKGARAINYKGKPRLAVVADLHITNPEAQEGVLKKRLPYRSVEIFDVSKPKIDSLALLDHEAPFLELPMLMISETSGASANVANATFSAPFSLDCSEVDAPVLACFRRGGAASLLFRDSPDYQQGGDMDEDKKKEDDEKKSEEMQEEGGGLNVEAIVKAIESGEISVADHKKILEAIAAQDGEVGEEPEEAAPAPAPAPGSMKREGEDDGDSEKFAALSGEVEALRAQLEKKSQDEARRKDVGEALEKLDGRPLGADLEQRLENFHREYGAKAFMAHVESMANTFAKLEPEEADKGQPRNGAPEVAMQYLERGIDAVDQAAKFASEWKELSDRGYTRMSEADYVANNMEDMERVNG